MLGQDETIFALGTAGGRGGIQVIRISGAGAGGALRALSGGIPPPRMLRFTAIRDGDGALLDRGMAVWFPHPASPTGEDYAELHLHGAPQIARLVLGALGALEGLRLAEAGEFTRRAFLNGKMSLDQAEALADVIDADTITQHRQAMARLDAPLSQITETWRAQLINMMAQLEAVLDFADEEIPQNLLNTLNREIKEITKEINDLINENTRGPIIRDGINIVLLGQPNAGKSTFLNALAGREEAIVSAEAGTTRDIISTSLDIQGYAVHIKDTAGLRPSQSAPKSTIEQEGVRRATKAAQQADIVVALIEANTPNPKTALNELLKQAEITKKPPIIMPVISKADLQKNQTTPKNWTKISAKTNTGLEQWQQKLSEIMETIIETNESALISRQRHQNLLKECQTRLTQAQKINLNKNPELTAEELRTAAAALGRISGRIDVEDVLDTIFRSFCIGK